MHQSTQDNSYRPVRFFQWSGDSGGTGPGFSVQPAIRDLYVYMNSYAGADSINPDPTKMGEPGAILGQPYQRWPTCWSQAPSYTMGKLPICRTISSGALSDAR